MSSNAELIQLLRSNLEWHSVSKFIDRMNEIMPRGMLPSSCAKLPNIKAKHSHEIVVSPRKIHDLDNFNPESTWILTSSKREDGYDLSLRFNKIEDAIMFRLKIIS